MRIRKSLTVFLAILLVFSQFTMVAAAPNGSNGLDPQRTKKVERHSEKVKAELDETYKETDEVRVIVELDGEPAITYATKKGKKFGDLSESEKNKLQSEALSAQETVQKQITKKKVDFALEQNFTTVFNGFSGIVKYGELNVIQELDGVKTVTVANEYERPEVTPDMKYSKELVEAQKTWDEYGYNGEGMIVGVIDSGIDPSHKDFVLSDAEKAALSEDDVNGLVAANDMPGQFYSDKVPYGYNYMDENSEVRDLGPGASMHGMHVSGTVGANGDEESGGLKGVAPEAQILGLKVFGNDPKMGSTWSDIYIKAIDDAIILGADVINMSLGSSSAFVDGNDPEQQAVARAVDNGVLMSISAGNSSHYGSGFWNPYASNPDIGVVGSPSVSTDSLSVASLENSFMDMDALGYTYGDNEGLFPYMSASDVHPNDIGGAYEIEYVGTGTAEDFAGKDLTGKFAIVVRGNSFTDTAFNAMNANAEGVIVYNHSDGWVNMASDPSINIPQLFMLKTDGDELKAALDAGETVTISFNGEDVTAANPLADSMSAFTSWGVTPNLDFKPEITAPGGNILSTFNDDQYGTMSGTSMAAPHVAGGSALVLQRVDEEFNLEGQERVEMAKNILMNTATPVVDKGTVQGMFELENPYSPRRQGAGLMQLHKAISTPVVVTEVDSGLGKVVLKEVNDQISFTLEATNFSDEAVTYDVAANVQTDLALFGELGYAADELEAQELQGAKVQINGGESTIDIAANSTETIEVTIDLSEAKVFNENASGVVDPEEVFPNGYFVEGFVTLSNEANPELSVPYVGFNGDWNDAPVVDPLPYDENVTEEGDPLSFYEAGAMIDGEGYILGFDPFSEGAYGASFEKLAISPNGDGLYEEAVPVLSFLRNAKKVEYNVLDADKNKLRTILSENNVRKNFYDGGQGTDMYNLDWNIFWDGTVNNKVVEDGQYYIEVKTTIDFPGAEAQSFLVPVKVDTTAPTVEASLEGNVITVNGEDETSGLLYYQVIVDGVLLEDMYKPSSSTIELGEGLLAEDSEVAVVAVDAAGNSTLHVMGDKNAPIIQVETPGTFEIVPENDVYVLGLVSDDSGIESVTVKGQEATLFSLGGGQYIFEADVYFEDGAQPIEIVATDINGNVTKLSKSRTIFVDSKAPKLEVENAPTYVGHETTEVDLQVRVSDNAEELRLLVNNNEVYYNEMPGYQMVAFADTVSTTVSLQPGENVFELELTDLAGHTTVEEVTVYRAQEGEEQASRISGDNRYDTAVEVSKQGWDKADVAVLARGDSFADALAGVPLAKKYDAPLLLTKTNTLSAATKDELVRLGVDTVYLLGGQAAISTDVEKALKDLGITVKRFAGDDRAHTAALIADEVTDGYGYEAVLVNGYNFPDALAVASYAADKGLPILLTRDDKLPKATEKALYDLDVYKTLVIGGEAAVSKGVANDVPKAYRIAGDNRYETAVEVAEYFDAGASHYLVTTGLDFPDALSSGALAAKEGTGILLVRNSVSDEVSKFLTDNNVNTVNIIGGTNVISDDVKQALNDLLKK